MTEPLRFGESRLLPSRVYAEGWPDFTRERWTRTLAAYRDRVRDLYEDLAEQHSDCFSLLRPLEVYVVVSLAKEWVFTRPADADSIVMDQRWEDACLAQRSMLSRADHERVVREAVGLGVDYELYRADDYNMRFDLDRTPHVASSNPEYSGREEADSDARVAIGQPQWERAINALMGREINEAALAGLRSQLETIAELQGTRRGNRFETWFGELLKAHGCDVEPGVNGEGEQVDFFVHKPFRAVVECRWKQRRLQPRELADLTAKLGRRPAVVAGIYVAWSGFTENCRRIAAQEPNGRTVLLWDAGDLQRLLSGEIHAHDLFEEHVSDRVRRYPMER
ncbi:restriction endonuclease [Streptomyces sp. NPDC005566]|uniref:restriction endonuclease n=1 Tax=Streptomyces sp. NPDC005566 TaxID=3156886 RepID=UPI0033AC60B6